MERDNKGRFKKKYYRIQKQISCACGCRKEFNYLDNSNRPRKYILGHHSKINHPFKGKRHTLESKEKISKNNMGRPAPKTAFKKGFTPWNKNLTGYSLKPHSKKVKLIVSEKKKEHWKREKYREYMTNILRKNRKEQIFPIKDTSIEVKIQNYLKELHIEFFTHYYISEITHSYQCDIFIPEQNRIAQKTIIECDGCFFHACSICNIKEYEWTKERRELDKIRTKELQEKGYKVIRLWEHEINKMSIQNFERELR